MVHAASRKISMKNSLVFVGALVLALAGIYIYAAGRAERNARFVQFTMNLKDAQLRLHAGEVLTNSYQDTHVYVFTNRYVFGGTNYNCELAGENKWFADRGPLAITTNQLFLWVNQAIRANP